MKIQLLNSRYRYNIKNSEGYLKGCSFMDIILDSSGLVKKIILSKRISSALAEIIRGMPSSINETFSKEYVTNPFKISLILKYLE